MMNRTEAASLIQAITDSLSKNPTQFHLDVKATGTNISVSGGGTGLTVRATGIGAGSTTIGYQSSAGSGDIQIVQKVADKFIQEQMSALVIQLQTIANELKSESPNHDKIRQIYHSFKVPWVPNVICSVLGNVLTMALGISL